MWQSEEQNREAKIAPPTNEEFIAGLRQGVEASHFISMRGKVIPVRVLSIDEINMIRRKALQETAKLSGDEVDRNLYTQKLTLSMATKMGPKEFPLLTESSLGQLSIDEVGYLYEEYLHVLARFNPRIEDISLEEFRSVVELVKKKNVGWNDLSLRQLRAIFKDWALMIQKPESPPSPPGS